jgi:isocitrate lyase
MLRIVEAYDRYQDGTPCAVIRAVVFADLLWMEAKQPILVQ